ncbi:MAG: GNAT family N-acyltransferase [Amaricoccus sp.]
MSELRRSRYRVRYAADATDIAAAQALRYAAFRGEGDAAGRDSDAFDARALHLLIEERRGGRLVCCCRLLPLKDGAEIAGSYSAQFYDLSGLAAFPGPMLELGRFCIAADARDPDILRLAWGALNAYVERHGIALIFGCSSFEGTEAERYAAAFALLSERHLAPRRWRPKIKAPAVVRFARAVRALRPDPLAALRVMPPLLRSYLAMGGWVSDHAVVDRDLGTLHVFTGLEVGAVPAARARRLRALAG